MRLLALVPKMMGRSPSQRFRLEQWSPILASNHGIELTFAAFESPSLSRVLYEPGHTRSKIAFLLQDGLRRIGVLKRAKSFDGIVVHREATLLGGGYIEWIAKHVLGLPLIYDFDDAIWEVAPSQRNGFLSLVRAPWKTAGICRSASAITVGNQFLADYARQYNADVNIVRTSIDLDRYRLQLAPDGPFTVVWTGSHSTLQHLETLRGVFAELGARHPTRVRIVCDERPPDFANVENEFIRWTPETEATALHSAHVGVMPLPDTLSARGKCGCKALQYMAIGRPAVVSPVGINSEIVRNGINGFCASSVDEWLAALLAIAESPELGIRLGLAGRATVEREYSAVASAKAFATVAQRVMAARS